MVSRKYRRIFLLPSNGEEFFDAWHFVIQQKPAASTSSGPCRRGEEDEAPRMRGGRRGPRGHQLASRPSLLRREQLRVSPLEASRKVRCRLAIPAVGRPSGCAVRLGSKTPERRKVPARRRVGGGGQD